MFSNFQRRWQEAFQEHTGREHLPFFSSLPLHHYNSTCCEISSPLLWEGSGQETNCSWLLKLFKICRPPNGHSLDLVFTPNCSLSELTAVEFPLADFHLLSFSADSYPVITFVSTILVRFVYFIIHVISYSYWSSLSMIVLDYQTPAAMLLILCHFPQISFLPQ